MDTHLRIGLPTKGRLAEDASGLLKQAGLKFRRQDRSLFAKVSGLPIEIIFLRTDDIPVLCAESALDMGITGGDCIEEAGVDLTTRLALGMGKCRLSVCVPHDSPAQSAKDLGNARIATSFTNVTQNYFNGLGSEVHLVPLSGSVEIMISLGVADAIVDLVETGSTLVANKLRVLEDIGSYETMLVQNSNVRLPEMADRITRRLEGVVIARSWSLLEYNVPRENLEKAFEITPGFNSPTVNRLERDDWAAIRVMVKRKELNSVMDELEAIDAKAILETQISNCRL
ncbi:MAG: ATP phosphoribosyltransferase [Opitutales bacterium]|nr:ATP phosphoribosyltransferase [Opitutales bacterium]NRA25676.1 ATP phosphoribosyltransferase [Opitutales bacterium]